MSRNLIALQNKFLGQGQTVYDALQRLHAAQGYISDADIERLAQEFHLPRAHIRSTAKFYEELSHSTPARHVVKVCNGEACRCAGYERVAHTLRERFGVGAMGDTSASGVRLEHVTCLGYCGLGPNAMVDGVPVSLAEPGALDRVVAHATADAPLGLHEPSNPFYLPAPGKPCILLRRFGADVTTLAAARAAGAYTALEKAVTRMTPEQVIAEVKASELRGRGGAGFPTGIKLETVRRAAAPDGRKFIVVNADEGDAGSYIDKELLERDPHGQLEGVLIAAYAAGAREAIVYIRFEYPRAIAVMRNAIEEARAAGLIGAPLFGSDFACDVRVVQGAGAYICGEETSLLRSIEGVPAIVSFKPPFPAEKGLFGCPTAVNNVETLHNLPWIVERGGAAYAALGMERSRGTKLVSLNTRVKRPGLYEIELGTTLRELIFDLAGGMADGQRFKAVQVGGPLGGIFPERLLDTPLAFEPMMKAGGMLGHAGVVVYSEEDDLMVIGRALMHFCAVESCGKCFPCRIGSVRGTELFDQMMETGVTDARLSLLKELIETMEVGSLCALGGMIPIPIRNLVEFFPEEFERYRRPAAAAVS
jgi:NADH:ubiquinone oxidoreductase subunit F (NADH-binding)/NADH:ubiquinone oxidoreductase subunit E